MGFGWKAAGVLALAALCVGGGGYAAARTTSSSAAAATAAKNPTCQLGFQNKQIKHVIYIQFDNTHYRRDAAGVPSDLEQMPHLLNFMKSNGTLFTNDHTILISHTAGGILSTLTGLYPDRNGQTVSNSYDFFQSGVPNFRGSSFQYWTSPVNTPGDPAPNMITDDAKNTPAPWVPFTRAGCDVGGVGAANIELENNSTDVANVYGATSPEAAEPATQKLTDFVGIAIHCGSASTICKDNTHAKTDALPDEPGGYNGFQGLFGAKYVDQSIAPSTTGNCVPDTEKAAGVAGGVNVVDSQGHCGFPGFDGMEPHNSLGYVEQMQESGVPVTFAYISDAHDTHVPNPTTDAFVSNTTGPGEASHNAQLAAYDQAFADFFSNLANHGIDKSNTLFVITVDEGDHFAGGVGIPQADGSLAYSHAPCDDLTACPTNELGEIDTNIDAVLPSGEPAFDIHFDDAPAVYVNGQPSRDDPSVRKLERDVGNLSSVDPYIRDSTGAPETVQMTQSLADPVELATLHMVNQDPNRTPTFVMFAQDDFWFNESNCDGKAKCIDPVPANPAFPSQFAWNHGDSQSEIGNTWVGFVGPGVASNGVDSTTWTDHTNVRPTMLALLGLKDDYEQDGHVLVQALTNKSIPPALRDLNGHDTTIEQLEQEEDLVNAPFGTFAKATLAASTFALKSSDDDEYNSIEDQIKALTDQRNELAGDMKDELYQAAVNGQPINEKVAQDQIAQAKDLIAQAAQLRSD